MAMRTPPPPMALTAPNTSGSPAIPGALPTPPAPIPDIASLNINVPPVPAGNPGRDREAQLLRRIRELEDENRAVRAENEKQVCYRFQMRYHPKFSWRVTFLESDDCQIP